MIRIAAHLEDRMSFISKIFLQTFYKIWVINLCKNSTIFALSSGFGKSGVAVFRISGNKSHHVVLNMTNFKKLPEARKAYLKTILDYETKEPLDKGLLLWFPGPKSFTGENMCELQVHGSKAVIHAIMNALLKIPDFRPAEPGEFTKRAFYAGKFDLTEVEGLSDLIDAETEIQRKQALYQMGGSLRELYLNWRKIISENLALIEAYIDFSEDENIEDNIIVKVKKNLESLRTLIQKHLNDYRKGEILRDGIRTVIIGAPNVGKSSLLNLLCERPAAIVTEIAGTTRDIIQSMLNINGYPVILSDTAGIRKDTSDDVIELEGIRRSIKEASSADLLLLIIDARKLFENRTTNTSVNFNLSNVILENYKHYQTVLNINEILSHSRTIIVANKFDLLDNFEQEILKQFCSKFNNFITISCKTEEGIPNILSLMSLHFQQLCGTPNKSNPACSRGRHRHHLNECVHFLTEYLNIMEIQDPEEVIVKAAEKLRKAVWHLGMITGHVTTDEILSVIFKQFSVRPKTSILDKSLSKGKGEVNLTCFALLFLEIIQYCQNRSHSIPELQNKLSEFGKDVGSKLIDIVFIRREKNYKREIKLLDILIFIKSTFWKNLFGKEADKLEQANDDEYYLKEKDPLVNKFISVPKDKAILNCAVFTAGIIEAVLNSCGFEAKVTAHWYNGTTLYMMKFEDAVIARNKQLEER
ncbi:hypothetical protein PGB90_008075 [Kerria lacca]